MTHYVSRPEIISNPFCKHEMTKEAQEFWDMHRARGGGNWYQTGTYYYYWDLQNDYGKRLCPFHVWGWDLV